MMTARSIFPTVIDVRDEVLSADELKALKTAIEARRSRRVEDRARSLQGGERLTLDRETLLEPEFKPLATVIANTVSTLNRHLYSMATEKLHFSRFWVNFIAAGGFHHPHQHGNETWASVFYIDGGDSEAGGTLHFLDPRPAAFQPRQGQAPAAVPPVPVKAETNRLVMFPGWLQHYVTPYEGDGERIAMAINCRT